MSRKRTSLDAILAPPPAGEPVPAAPPPPAVDGGSRRPAVKQQTVYLPLATYEQLRRLAFEERVKMHQLLMEGLDRVFRARGLPGRAELDRRRG
ncbi:MAG TPA: hypothetical protein PKA13_23905 [Geminicoccaceae bacterium]|nr:hypothetical protein [Geminicoccus sp.]HMU52841.1 hypothetical protein [Geminicoccaceae bacterium]